MPMTEQCPLGQENKAKIEANKSAFEDFRDEIRGTVKLIFERIDEIANHYSNRLPLWATLLFGGMMSALVGLIVYSVK